MDDTLMVRCNWCEWEGEEADLFLEEDEEKNIENEFCPRCDRTGFLMDIPHNELQHA